MPSVFRRVKPGTLNRELDILRHAFAVARRNWDIPLAHNAFAEVTRPKSGAPRERRLHSGEQERLRSACVRCRNPYIFFLVQLALETAMRRGELLKMRWCDVSAEKRTLHIPVTKNGHARTIPLSAVALALLRDLRDHVARHPNASCLSPRTAQRWRGSDWSNVLDWRTCGFMICVTRRSAGFSRRASTCRKSLSLVGTATRVCCFDTLTRAQKTLL